MKILICYSSKTGNTEKLCSGVYNHIKNKADIDIMKMPETRDWASYDVVIPGFWVDKGTANRESRKFISRIQNRKVALLGTLGASPDSEHGEKVRKNAKELVDGSNEYLGVFLSRGKVNPKLLKTIKRLPLPSQLKDKMYESSVGSREPNETDIANAAEFIAGALKL